MDATTWSTITSRTRFFRVLRANSCSHLNRSNFASTASSPAIFAVNKNSGVSCTGRTAAAFLGASNSPMLENSTLRASKPVNTFCLAFLDRKAIFLCNIGKVFTQCLKLILRLFQGGCRNKGLEWVIFVVGKTLKDIFLYSHQFYLLPVQCRQIFGNIQGIKLVNGFLINL